MCEEVVVRQFSPQQRLDEACKVAQTFSMVSNAYGYSITLPSQCSEYCNLERRQVIPA